MESKDKQETILPDAMPEKIPMNSWKRSGVFLFVSVLCCTLFLGLLNFGGNDSAQADKANAPCQAPEQVVVRQVKPLGVDRSGCQKLPSNGVAKCYAGEVGVRFGRSENGYRRVYCGGCEKLVYPASKPTTVKLTINGGAQ